MLPAALAAATSFGAAAWLGVGRPWATSAGAMGALAAGYLAAHAVGDGLPLWPGPSPLQRLPAAALVALVGGWLVAALTREREAIVWPWRVAVAAVACRVFVPADLNTAAPWLLPATTLVVAAAWSSVECPAARRRGGPPLVWLAFALFVAAGVLIHAHSGRLMDVAVVAGSAVAGIAAVAAWRKSDASAAAPGGVVLLAGLLLVGHHETYSDVPATSFILPALAPLAPALALLPGVRDRLGRTLSSVQLGLVLLPLLAAVALAARAEPLSFE